MPTPATTRLLAALEATVASLGWDQPATLYAVRTRASGAVEAPELALTAEPVAVLSGNPVCALLRHQPTLDDDALGVALVTEGWAYGPTARAVLDRGEVPAVPPSQDPERVELRLAQLVLRDGTTQLIEHRRGETSTTREPDGPSWVGWTLRRCLGLASEARPPAGDLPLRLVLLWQCSNLLLLADGGYPIDRLPVEAAEWGRFTIPGLGEPPTGVRDPWWQPVEAALDSGTLDGPAFAAALRTQLAAASDDGVCLPLAFPLERGDDHVMCDAAMAAWMDDALLLAFVDATVPDRDVVAAGAAAAFPERLRAELQRRLHQG